MIRILRVKRPDYYSRTIPGGLGHPNRIPWNVYYVVSTADPKELGKLFRHALVVFPSPKLIGLIKKEILPNYLVSPTANSTLIHKLYSPTDRSCLCIPSYIYKNYYAYQYSSGATRSKDTTLGAPEKKGETVGEGLGRMFFLENSELVPFCTYCKRAPYYISGDCRPGTDRCLKMYWRECDEE